jgi:hypothetical protein
LHHQQICSKNSIALVSKFYNIKNSVKHQNALLTGLVRNTDMLRHEKIISMSADNTGVTLINTYGDLSSCTANMTFSLKVKA